MPIISFYQFIAPLNEENFAVARNSFATNGSSYGKMKKEESTQYYMKVFTQENVLNVLTPAQLASIWDTLFHSELKDEKVVLNLMEDVDSVLKQYSERLQENPRAKKYDDYVHGKLLAEAKDKKSEFFAKSYDEQIEVFVDYLKAALALYAYAQQEDKTYFELNVTEDAYVDFVSEYWGINQKGDRLAKAHQLAEKQAGVIGKGIARGIKQGIGKAAIKAGGSLGVAEAVKDGSDMILDVAGKAIRPGMERANERIAKRIKEMNQYDERKLFFNAVTWLVYLRIIQEDSILQEGM